MNLRPVNTVIVPNIAYSDHTGTRVCTVVQCQIKNENPTTSIDVKARLRELNKVNEPSYSPDRSYLKWAGQMGYQRTIFPAPKFNAENLDLFSVNKDTCEVYLHSASDVPRKPIINQPGCYILTYELTEAITGFIFRFNVGLVIDKHLLIVDINGLNLPYQISIWNKNEKENAKQI